MSYRKGVTYERELLYLLNGRGFAVMRAPSSGGWLSPVDVIAMKKGLILAIECKAWQKKPKLDSEKQKRMTDWSERAGAISLLAWRTKEGWQFSKLEMPDVWLTLDDLLSVF